MHVQVGGMHCIFGIDSLHNKWAAACHNENMPIQIYWNIENFTTKKWNFQIKNSDMLKNIDYGYSLEPPRWGGSNEYP